MTDNMRGALLMMGSMAGFTLNDAVVKFLGQDMPLFQMIALRGVMATLLIFVLAKWFGAFNLRFPKKDAKLIALRLFAEVGATVCFLSALMQMPIANVTAILQVLPLTVTLAGALFLGEKVGWRRMMAIIIGFGGMLLIVRPGPDGFNSYILLALAAVCFVTTRDIVTRRLSREVSSLSVSFVTAAGVTIFACVASLSEPWVPVSTEQWSLLALAAVFIFAGYLFAVMVMRVGEVGFIAPFRYTSLLWALVLGYFVFGDWPDSVTLLGAAIVVATGVFSLSREAMLARRALKRG